MNLVMILARIAEGTATPELLEQECLRAVALRRPIDAHALATAATMIRIGRPGDARQAIEIACGIAPEETAHPLP